MKNRLFFLTVLLLIFSIATKAQEQISKTGQVIESAECPSKILPYNINYSIYLPPDYATSNRKYPVVYLLHGYTDNETGWVQFGEANIAADKLISTGEIAPMIIVMPDAKLTFYINDYQGKINFEDAFFQEFIPFIESKYRIKAQREFRAVSGLSMGGFGSLVYAMHHTDMFSVCVPFSGVVLSEKKVKTMGSNIYQIYVPIFGNFEGESRLTEHLKKNSPYFLASTMDVAKLKSVKWYIDCGDDDFLSTENDALHDVLVERQIPHEYRVRDGAHKWIYWRTGIFAGLKFINDCFHR
jgi:enterochelin esterase-like enzyme